MAETGGTPGLCAGLIDQGRRIGDDPVGHACGGWATETVWSGGLGFPVCASCAGLFRADSPRLTLAWWKGRPGEG